MKAPLRLLWRLMAVLGWGGLLWASLSPSKALADPRVQIHNPQVDYRFGERLTFSVEVEATTSVTQVEVFYHAQALTYTLAAPMEAASGTPSRYTYTHDLHRQPLPPFAQVTYWFRVTLKDGYTATSAPQTFVLRDNRFPWAQLQEGPFVVFWYEGDEALARQVLNAAQQGLTQAQRQWLAPTPSQVTFYIYASTADLQSALRALPQWAAGHAAPELGKAFLSLPPGLEQGLEIRRQVPHELAHLLLYQATQDGYTNLPRWLNEGIASLTELRPNPDYDVVLHQAIAQHALIPLASLCQRFPTQAAQATLAYSESLAFTRYLYHMYGPSGLHDLILAYAQGGGCEEAPQKAVGQPLTQLERAWLATLGALPLKERWQNLTPWMELLALVLLPLLVILFARWGHGSAVTEVRHDRLP